MLEVERDINGTRFKQTKRLSGELEEFISQKIKGMGNMSESLATGQFRIY